jgi:agmatinase
LVIFMQKSRFLHFAEANAEWNDAKFVILGVPFDGTCSYRPGTKFGPNAMREASYNFEIYHQEHDFDLGDVPIFDAGNIEECGSADATVEAVEEEIKEILQDGKFPLMLGGEHSISSGALRAFRAMKRKVAVIQFDAHLDFRDDYLGQKNSHACASRRISDVVGVSNVVLIGVRSICKDEMDDAKRLGLKYFTADEVVERGMMAVVDEALKYLKTKDIYLTVDIDGLDPSYAPGVGTPEPFGLSDRDLKLLITKAAPRMVGFDLVEVSPPCDQGNTAALGARLIRELLVLKGKNK